MAEPRERPILFSGPMVRAILDGRKTQTRRVIAPAVFEWQWVQSYGDGTYGRVGPDFESNPFPCPYGQPGDRLWVRERARVGGYHGTAFRTADEFGRLALLQFEADGTQRWVVWPPRMKHVGLGRCVPNGVHREGARIFLEVTGIRVERLHDISEADATAEGIDHELAFTEGLVTRARDSRPGLGGEQRRPSR